MPINLDEVGAFPSVDADGNLSLRVGLYPPGIRKTDGFQVVVRIIHKSDRFDPAIVPVDVNLDWQQGSALVVLAVPNTASGRKSGRRIKRLRSQGFFGGSPRIHAGGGALQRSGKS
jgi:hypothetical protein